MLQAQAFLSLDGLDSFLADRLFTVVSQGQDSVSFDQLVIAKANCLKVQFLCHFVGWSAITSADMHEQQLHLWSKPRRMSNLSIKPGERL